MALLGGLIWALGLGTSNQGPPEGAVAERVEVPDVVGLPQDEAQERLEEVGLKLGSRDEAPSDDVATGTVTEQDPSAGTEVDRGRTVNVVISTGPLQEPTPRASPSAATTATATASPAAVSPAAGEAAEEAAKEEEKIREEAQKKAEERSEEAQDRAEERRKEQEKEGK